MVRDEEALAAKMREAMFAPVSEELARQKAVEEEVAPNGREAAAGPRDLAPPLGLKASEGDSLWDRKTYDASYAQQAQSSGAPVDPGAEAARMRAARRLSRAFAEMVRDKVSPSKVQSHLEAWLHAKSGIRGREEAIDPVLPSGRESEREEGLQATLMESGCDGKEARAICRELGKFSSRTANQLARRQGKAARKVRISEAVMGMSGRRKARLACGIERVEINRKHMAKLWALMRRFRPDWGPTEFKRAVFALAARYAAQCGGRLKSGGTQAACHPAVMGLLNSHLGVSLELFASPFNCRWAPFCSPHADVDAPFGSLGSAFEFRPRSGSFQANPPYQSGFVKATASHICGLLEEAPIGSELSFVVILPERFDWSGWKRMAHSQHLARSVRLEPFEHGFIEGQQHSKSSWQRPSVHPTSVFVLQTEAAKRRWPADDRFEALLRDAFHRSINEERGGGKAKEEKMA